MSNWDKQRYHKTTWDNLVYLKKKFQNLDIPKHMWITWYITRQLDITWFILEKKITKLGYPKTYVDNLVYAGFRDTRWDIQDPPESAWASRMDAYFLLWAVHVLPKGRIASVVKLVLLYFELSQQIARVKSATPHCLPSLQSGLPTTCKMSWGSLTRQIPEAWQKGLETCRAEQHSAESRREE